ncbi:winged helix DNA-binding protein [Actinoallomurus bryophytorum]|uniref:Winged helix DNA-binding protein n=1 Tax=Actinoallomurus bryophytorum TaxID=1490222 RepID=A0A543BT27_9ACTN|nr:winged helix DNA-binding protein [Actinoallomurus bryophytorum]
MLDRYALNRALFERQSLLRPAGHTALQAVERLVGMQAQAPLAPYVGLWTRLRDFRPDDLAGLITGRQVVRIALMRGTIHLVTAADCRTLRPLLQPLLDRALRSGAGRRLTGLDLHAIAAAGRELVDERPRTFGELGAALTERWPGHAPADLAHVIRALVPLVQVPPRGLWGHGGQATHTSAETWLGGRLDPAPALDDLVLRYLAGYGPATPRDIQVWSGLTRLREVVDGLRPRLRVFHDEHGNEVFDLPDAPRPDPGTPAPPRFLPEYDNLLRSHADRTRVLPGGHRDRLATPNDSPRPAFLVDGFVHGTWKLTRARGTATLTIEPFASLPDPGAVTAEAARLLEFAAAGDTHDIKIAEVTAG